MAGKLIVDTIDTDNAFITLNVQQSLIATMNVSGIYSNTGVKMIGANGTVSNTAITGNIISSQISPSVTLTTPIISGNLNLDSAGTTGIRVPSANTIAFYGAGTEDMRIDSSGNVGIGTASPTSPLQVNTAGVDTTVQINSTDANGGYGAVLALNNTGTGGRRYGLFSTSNADGDVGGGRLKFYDLTAGATRMLITTQGYLCLGGASNTTYNETLRINTANQQGIHINDTTSSSSINYQYFTKGSGPTNIGAIYYNGSVMAYQTTSDYRLKENVAPITNALNKISLLKPVTYTWKDNQQSGEGFLAHELQEHFPDAVSGTKDDVDENGKPKYQGMDSSVLIATMVKAIQEQQAIISDLKARIEVLEA